LWLKFLQEAYHCVSTYERAAFLCPLLLLLLFFPLRISTPFILRWKYQSRLLPGTKMQSPPYEEFGASLKKYVLISSPSTYQRLIKTATSTIQPFPMPRSDAEVSVSQSTVLFSFATPSISESSSMGHGRFEKYLFPRNEPSLTSKRKAQSE